MANILMTGCLQQYIVGGVGQTSALSLFCLWSLRTEYAQAAQKEWVLFGKEYFMLKFILFIKITKKHYNCL